MKQKLLFLLTVASLISGIGLAQQKQANLSFKLTVKDPATRLYHIDFICAGIKQSAVEFKMSNWTPGYYQFMKYAENVSGFSASSSKGEALQWEKNSDNSWKINSHNLDTILISYDIKSTRPFVATTYLSADMGYVSPAGVFLYPSGLIKNPVTVSITPAAGWTTIATGLETVKDQPNTFTAPDYDVLFDSPFLMGKLESFPSFTVNNIPHYFIAYKAGEFDRNVFMNDMKKIVTTASGIIGNIPYKHYSFLGIGPGGGGIEHLNSASVAFEGSHLNTKEGLLKMYHFLAHEYFHHYNVKRIRPIELGPFDYDKGSRTKMLWLSEGVNVYYEYMIVKRAGFSNEEDILQIFSNAIRDYENKPGRNFQTPAEASYTTWEDGPFGRTGDEVNKTISPYDKGPALGILLDFKIRHETGNRRSLDDLMRFLYSNYYQRLGRGFTEQEFQTAAERIAGTSLKEFFDYIYTLKTVDYPTYFSYAGLTIDTATHTVPGAWLGLGTRTRNDSLFISSVDWQSPAWNADIRGRNALLAVNGKKVSDKELREILAASKDGDKLLLSFLSAGEKKEATIILGTKKEKPFTIKKMDNPAPQQTAILKSWMGEK